LELEICYNMVMFGVFKRERNAAEEESRQAYCEHFWELVLLKERLGLMGDIPRGRARLNVQLNVPGTSIPGSSDQQLPFYKGDLPTDERGMNRIMFNVASLLGVFPK